MQTESQRIALELYNQQSESILTALLLFLLFTILGIAIYNAFFKED